MDPAPPTNNHPEGNTLTAGEAPSRFSAFHEAPDAGRDARDETPHAPRGLAYRLWMFRTRKGQKSETADDVRQGAAVRGAGRGHAAATAEKDIEVEVAQADGIARRRAAKAAIQALKEMTGWARRYVVARKTEARARMRENQIDAEFGTAKAEFEWAEEAHARADAASPAPPKPPPRTEKEARTAAIARRPISKRLNGLIVVCAALGGAVESFFSGMFASDAGDFGLSILSPELSLVLPWIAGLAIGELMVFGSALAGHASVGVSNPRNPAYGPWWRRHPAGAFLGAIGAFAGLRAIYGAVAIDLAAGILGLAVGGVMLVIGVVSAASGAELARQERERDEAAARAEIDDEERLARTLPPTPIERCRDALKRYRDRLDERVRLLRDERDAYRSIGDLAGDEKVQAGVEVRAAATRSRLEAEEEDGLADEAIPTGILRADVVEATYRNTPIDHSWRDMKKLRRRELGDGELPQVKPSDVLPDFRHGEAEETRDAYSSGGHGPDGQ